MQLGLRLGLGSRDGKAPRRVKAGARVRVRAGARVKVRDVYVQVGAI